MNLARREGTCAVPLLSLRRDDSQYFGFRGGQLDVIANAPKHGLGRAALFDDERLALSVHAFQELPKTGARIQDGNH